MELALAAGLALALLVTLLLWRRERRRRRELSRRLSQQERERSEAQLDWHRRLGWLDSGIAASGNPILVFDNDLVVRYVNGAAEELFGRPGDGETLIRFSHSLELEQVAERARDEAAAGGVERLVEIEGHPYLARAVATDEAVGLALTDVAEVRRLARARQDMVANLSHELRTPLTSLRLLAETVQGHLGKDPQVVRESAAKITREVELLHQMFQEMLDLSAIESGRQLVRLRPTRLGRIVAGALDQLREQAASKDVTVVNDVDPKRLILADEAQAQRALINVMHNAVKFAQTGGEIRLSAEAERDRVVLKVEDDGPGIDPDELERVFERFYRADQARGTAGTGLGLAIVRHIMEAHGGDAWAENRPPPASGAALHLAFQRG